jgi:HK97 family phage major capsid protein
MDFKQLNDEIQTTFGQMKSVIDEQAKTLKQYGDDFSQVPGEVKTSLEKFNARLDGLEMESKKLRLTTSRPMLGAADGDWRTPSVNQEAAERKDMFFRAMSVGPENMGREEVKAFREAFSVRRGSDLDERQTQITIGESKALTVGDNTTGGYLAPPEFIQDIIKGVQLISPIRPLAQVRQTNRRSVQYPVRSGVFSAKWVSETGTRAETAGLTYALEEIPNHELYADILVSDQDLEDAAFNLEQEILDNCTEQFAKAEGAAFVNGSAMGQPEGMLTNSNISATTQTTSATGLISAAGIIQIWTDLKTVYAKNATWLLNRASIGQVRSLADSQGRYLWEPGLADGTPPNLLGSPYVEVPDMPNTPTTATTTYPVIYGNIKRGYLIVDRIAVIVRRLQEKYAETGQVAYLVRKRVGGQVVLPEAIRKLGAVHS